MSLSVLPKWGNSLPLRVPKEVASNFREGDQFEVFSDASGMHFKKSRKIKRYDIGEVIAHISTEENGEMD